LAKTADPDAAFIQFDRFLSNLSSGVAVFALLSNNPRMLEFIAEIAGSSPRLAEYLGRNPSVLDALLDKDFLTALPAAEDLQSRFATELASAPDYEAALDAARRFAREERFRIGIHVIRGSADPATIGPVYAAVAETVIAGLQPVVEAEMAKTHGH